MRHFILTRSVYSPNEWPIDTNRRRLEYLRGITARSLRSQTARDFTWVVQLHPDDPLHAEREAIVAELGGYTFDLETSQAGPADLNSYVARIGRQRDARAVQAYGGWAKALPDPAAGCVLTTRIDDDDAFAPAAVYTIQTSIDESKRQAIILQRGIRVYSGRYSEIIHRSNAWATLVTPDGDGTLVYDFPHRQVARHAPIVYPSSRVRLWLWVRHHDTISGHHASHLPLTDEIRSIYDVDWSLLPELPDAKPPFAGRTTF